MSNKLLNNLLNMYMQAQVAKRAEDNKDLQTIFEESLKGKEPVIETANGILYFQPKGDQIIFGSATNVGISQDYVFDYDYDYSFDQNIQEMIMEVLEQENNKIEASKKIKLTKKAKIVLEQINNEYFLNGKKGDYSDFNNDGKYKQISYNIFVDKEGKTHKVWEFAGTLDKKAGIPDVYKNNAIVKRIEEMLAKMDMKIKSIEGKGLDYKKVNTDSMMPGSSSFSGNSFKEILNKVNEYFKTSRYNKQSSNSKTKSMRKRAGYSNNPDYFGDWFGKGQIDFSKIINPNDSGDVYMVKIWGGSGYILDVYLVKAQDEYDAIDKVFEWSYENEGANKLIFDYADIEKEAVEYYKDEPNMFGKELEEEDFIDRFMSEYYVANSDYSLFARAENFFVGKVPEEYLTKKETNASNKQKLNKKATKTLEEVAGLIDTILDDFDHYDYADQLEVGETSLYEKILADVQKDEKGTIESLFNRIKADGDESFTSKELVQLKEYYNNKFGKTATKKQAILQVSENGLGYVLPNGKVVYPGDEALLQTELRTNKKILEKDIKELERLEGIIKKYPDINFDKNKDSVKFQIPRVKKGIEYLELFNETIEDILKAFQNKKMGKQATIKHENGVYNVYSESGKCLGKGYKTKEEAEKRLKQVEYFKNKKSSLSRKAYLQISKEMIEDALNVLQIKLSLYDKKYNTDEEIGKAEIEQKNKEYNFTKKWNYEYGNFINRHNDVLNKLYKNQISIDEAVERINALEKQIYNYDPLNPHKKNASFYNKKKSFRDIIISKIATDLKDIPESVKNNILSDLIYVILTGKGSFAYKIVANKLKNMLVELGYADKLKANEDGSLPILEIVEQIAKEPKVRELAGKFANIAQIKATKKQQIRKAAEKTTDDIISLLEKNYQDALFSAWDNGEGDIEDTIYSILISEKIETNDKQVEEIADYFNVYFM